MLVTLSFKYCSCSTIIEEGEEEKVSTLDPLCSIPRQGVELLMPTSKTPSRWLLPHINEQCPRISIMNTLRDGREYVFVATIEK